MYTFAYIPFKTTIDIYLKCIFLVYVVYMTLKIVDKSIDIHVHVSAVINISKFCWKIITVVYTYMQKSLDVYL